MKRKISIKRWGNSAGISLSKKMRKHFHAGIGDQVAMQIFNEGLLIRSAQAPQYTLNELLSSCSSESVKANIEDIAWLQNSPVGKEENDAI